MAPPALRDRLDDDRHCLIGGRYRLGGQLGQGSMGTVYRALDNETGAAVAIKHLRPETTLRDPRSVTRFLREGEALRRLDHPNIVKLLGHLRGWRGPLSGDGAGGRRFTGGPPARPVRPLELGRISSIAADLSDALARAHQLDIVHRDLKPSNVLITDEGRLDCRTSAWPTSRGRPPQHTRRHPGHARLCQPGESPGRGRRRPRRRLESRRAAVRAADRTPPLRVGPRGGDAASGPRFPSAGPGGVAPRLPRCAGRPGVSDAREGFEASAS